MVSYLLYMTYNFWKIWNKICPCGLSDQTFSTLFESNPLDWNWTFAITFAIKTTKFEAAWHNGLRSILKEHYFLIFHDPKIKKKKSKNQVILSVFEKPISRCNIQILEVESFPTSPIIFSQNQFNRNTKFFLFLCSFCSNLSYMKKLQEQIKKAFCYQKLFWPFKVWIISLQPRILKVFREF